MKRVNNHPVVEPLEGRKEVVFTFNGDSMKGFSGEMISSSLFANGIKEFSLHNRDNAPQGIFCASGQCSQCTVMVDGMPLKSCVTPLREGMDIRTLKGLPELPSADSPFFKANADEIETDVVVVGGGPSGLTASIELAKEGFNVALIDDKDRLGGKLVLQTHKFFGSEEDCYAGTRGVDIATILESEAEQLNNIKILRNSSVAGVFKDSKIGVFTDNRRYTLISFTGMIVSAGARERSLLFHGNDLPGVYGAGAFQTLVNRDLIKASEEVFIIGSGNVGLIAAYHALQAGIKVKGIVEIAGKVSGYKVHADKIERMGVPIYLNTTVLSAEGDGRVERVTIAEVDDGYNPMLDTVKTFEVDTLLVAAGLTPVDEFYDLAKSYGFNVIKAGDAEEIAEASSAMFGGRIAGIKMAGMLGRETHLDPSFGKKSEILKSRPGKVHDYEKFEITDGYQPVFHCLEEIPCNPCATVCPKGSIKLREREGTIMDTPHLEGECTGCGLCVAACPGLAISLVRKGDGCDEITLPHEFMIDFQAGDKLPLTDIRGNDLCEGTVLNVRFNKKYKTSLVSLQVPSGTGEKVAGIRVQDESVTTPLTEPLFSHIPENSIVCRCERVTLGEILAYIKENRVTDINQLKQIRVGMGACGSKTCSVLLPRIFSMAGLDWNKVTPGTVRPLSVEVPMGAIVNEEEVGI